MSFLKSGAGDSHKEAVSRSKVRSISKNRTGVVPFAQSGKAISMSGVRINKPNTAAATSQGVS